MTSQVVPPVEQGQRRSAPLPPRGTKRRSLRHGDRYWAYLLIVPTAIGLTVFSIWLTRRPKPLSGPIAAD